MTERAAPLRDAGKPPATGLIDVSERRPPVL